MSEPSSSQQVVYIERPPELEVNDRADPIATKAHDLGRFHRLMRGRYHWAIILSIILGGTGAVIGLRSGKRTFQSSGIIRVMPIIPKIMYAVDEKGQIPAFDAFVDAQVALIKSQRVLDEAMEDKDFVGFDKSDYGIVQFKNSLDVNRQGDMIFVTATNLEPHVAMASVNAVISAYTKVYDDIDTKSDEKRRELREEYQTKLQNEWSSIRQQILDIAKVYGSDDLKPQYDFELGELNKVEEAIEELKRTLPEAAGVATTQPSHDLTAADVAAMGDRWMNELFDDEFECERQILELQDLEQGMANNPQLKTAQAKLNASREAIDRYLQDYKDRSPFEHERRNRCNRTERDRDPNAH